MFAGKTKKLAVAGQLQELTTAELTQVSGGNGLPFPVCQFMGFNDHHHHHRHHRHHHHRHHNFVSFNQGQGFCVNPFGGGGPI